MTATKAIKLASIFYDCYDTRLSSLAIVVVASPILQRRQRWVFFFFCRAHRLSDVLVASLSATPKASCKREGASGARNAQHGEQASMPATNQSSPNASSRRRRPEGAASQGRAGDVGPSFQRCPTPARTCLSARSQRCVPSSRFPGTMVNMRNLARDRAAMTMS